MSEPEDKIRLNKYISNSGYCARRKADELIMAGQVSVNGQQVDKLATWVTSKDKVVVNNTTLTPNDFSNPITLLFNKPTGVITTAHDPQGRETILECLKKAVERVIQQHTNLNLKQNLQQNFKVWEKILKEIKQFIAIGRLDQNTSGLILLTQDKKLFHQWAHPSKSIQKTYLVTCQLAPTKKASLNHPSVNTILERARQGIQLNDGFFQPDQVILKKNLTFEITIHSGKNRILRRYFKALGAPIQHLHRTTFHHFKCEPLKIGEFKIIKTD